MKTDFINKVVDFFLDKSKSIGLKTAMFISTLTVLIFIDLSIDFTYDLTINSKLEQLSKLDKLKKQYVNDKSKLILINQIEKDVFDKTHYSEWFDFSFSFPSFDNESIANDQKEPNIKKSTSKPKNPNILSKSWMTLTSSFSFWLMWPILLLLPFYQKKKQKGFFFGWLALNAVWASIIVMATVIAYQIPLIYNNPTFNYILNFIIHVAIIGLATYLIKKEK